jgi:hypothetical protein
LSPDSHAEEVKGVLTRDRATDDIEKLTGRPALTVAQYITENPQLFT